MNQPKSAACLCIISHPTKAEFMVIKHTDRWSPPIVMIPADEPIPNLAKYVTDGIFREYGLRTIALRQIISTATYHCIELEMIAEKGTKNLRAFWVGSKEYKKFRSSGPGQIDPLAQWLKEKKKRRVPGLRPTWARSGFFLKARNWIDFNLERLNVQTTGSVEQYDAFKTTSYTLRVPTSGGWVYFKAGPDDASPPEAQLTLALSHKWPDFVPQPLCVDPKKNWMLVRDYRKSVETRVEHNDYPEAVRVFAQMQLDSLDSMAEWQKLNGPVLELEQLSEFAGNLGGLPAALREGGGIALSAGDIEELAQSGTQMQGICKKLQEYSIPNMLVHPDLWSANMIKSGTDYSFIGWSGTVFAHPFFSILKLISFQRKEHDEPASATKIDSDDGQLSDLVLDSYLESFTSFESKERLLEAMSLLRQLQNLWNLYQWNQVIAREEHESVAYQAAARQLQKSARAIIGQARQVTDS